MVKKLLLEVVHLIYHIPHQVHQLIVSIITGHILPLMEELSKMLFIKRIPLVVILIPEYIFLRMDITISIVF